MPVAAEAEASEVQSPIPDALIVTSKPPEGTVLFLNWGIKIDCFRHLRGDQLKLGKGGGSPFEFSLSHHG